jgi:tetrahydromethanopterin S-methyltransferase subunit B
MSYSDIAKGRESPVTTQRQNKNPDDASVDTTVVSNLSCQDNTNMLGLSVVIGLSIMKKRMEEIDKQRDESTTKQQRMDDSISSVTGLVSKLTEDILVVQIDMNKMSDKLEHKSNQIIASLAMIHTTTEAASPPRKNSRATKKTRKQASPFGGVVTQLKLPTPPASPTRDFMASTWANYCDSENEYISHSVAILKEVDSVRVKENPRDHYAVWVGTLRPSPTPRDAGNIRDYPDQPPSQSQVCILVTHNAEKPGYIYKLKRNIQKMVTNMLDQGPARWWKIEQCSFGFTFDGLSET